MARYRPLNAGFSTADASNPTFQLQDERLSVAFDNWQETKVTVVFEDAVAVRWEEGDSLVADHRDDECYRVEESPWLEGFLRGANIQETREFRHFRLCFNAIGVLDVIATRFTHH